MAYFGYFSRLSLQYSFVSPDFFSNPKWINSWKGCGDEFLLAYLPSYVVNNAQVETRSIQNGGTASTVSKNTELRTSKTAVTTYTTDESPMRSSGTRNTMDSWHCWKESKYAYGLKVFDVNVHKHIKQIPITVIQQYTSRSLSKRPYYPNDHSLVRCGEILLGSDIYGSYEANNIIDLIALSKSKSFSSSILATTQTQHNNSTTGTSAHIVTSNTNSIPSSNSSLAASSVIGSTVEEGTETTTESQKFTSRLLNVANQSLPETHPFRESVNSSSVHLIILQHGFLGTSFDMRTLQNALIVEGPPNFFVYTPTDNDEYNGDSIDNTALRLVEEICELCSNKFPFLLVDGSSKSSDGGYDVDRSSNNSSGSKVSFIGHSMGKLFRTTLSN